MKKNNIYVCEQCSHQVSKWMGKCPECSSWNSIIEVTQERSSRKSSSPTDVPKYFSLKEVSVEKLDRIDCNISEFNRVLGGGIVPGSLILLGGEPGIGKSTLLLQVMGNLAKAGKKILYVSGEESCAQIFSRSKRLGIDVDNFYLAQLNSLQEAKEIIKKIKPDFFVLDSIQTTVSDELDSPPGTVSQVREITYQIMNLTKENSMTSFLIGHVTKEGSIAGPKILEHMVDTVIYFEGEQADEFRLIRAIKNRFGSTHEIGIFSMRENGLVDVQNPSLIFIDRDSKATHGRALSCIIEGTRSIFVEIQTLVISNKFGLGRRTTQGLDNNRLAMLLAIFEKYFSINLSFNDVYLNVVGGLKLTSRDTDLCIIMSILSSLKKIPLKSTTIYLGEVGLTGEIRTPNHLELRLREAERYGLEDVYLSQKAASEIKGSYNLKIHTLSSIKDLLRIYSVEKEEADGRQGDIQLPT